MTQSVLAQQVGVRRSAVAQWESAAGTSPSTANLAKVAIATGVRFEWLATGRGSSSLDGLDSVLAVDLKELVQDETEARILEILRRLNAKDRQFACGLIELLAT